MIHQKSEAKLHDSSDDSDKFPSQIVINSNHKVPPPNYEEAIQLPSNVQNHCGESNGLKDSHTEEMIDTSAEAQSPIESRPDDPTSTRSC